MKIIIVLLLTTTFMCPLFALDTNEPAVKFLQSLDAPLRQKVQMPFDDPSKTTWHFFPGSMVPRAGIQLKELNAKQKELLQALLQSFLSETGYTKTMQIVQLENILLEAFGDPVMRDAEKYFVAFYGNPEADKLWAWSFEGHHLSLNFTVHEGVATIVPRFMGASPATILSGKRKGERTLAKEEDLGLQLINAFSDEQRKVAIFQQQPFAEIVTSNATTVAALQPVGISFKALNESQKLIFLSLLDEYLSAMPRAQADKRMENIKKEELDELRFGWAGATVSGKGHYYRIQGKSFLVEFDNTQGNANHIHSVWRDFDGDFGRDLIREHYLNDHRH